MGTMKNVDRRIQRTKQIISDAFLSLCHEKKFEDIIIKDITERANVNRSTFYAHYYDKDDLFAKIGDEKLTELENLAREHFSSFEVQCPAFEAADPYYLALFEHLEANKTFYSLVLGKMGSSYFSDKMLQTIRESYYFRISRIGKEQKLLIPLDILLDYTSSSLQGIIRNWFAQQTVYSARHMALQLTRLSSIGTYEAMGLPIADGQK